MNKIILLLLLTFNYSYSNDTVTTTAIKNINLREDPSIESKIISKIKKNDTLRLISSANNWSTVLYQDTLKGFVKTEFTTKINNSKLLKTTTTNNKSIFFKILFFSSTLFFPLFYILKKKFKFLEVNGLISIISKSIIMGFISTIILIAFLYYDNLSFLKLLSIIILIPILIYTFSFAFFSENEIYINKSSLKDDNIKISSIDNNYIENFISENNLILKDIKTKYNANKSIMFNLLAEAYGHQNTAELIDNRIPIVGMPYLLVIHYFGQPEKINYSSESDDNWQTFFYNKINNRGNDGIWGLKIHMLNNVIQKFEIR